MMQMKLTTAGIVAATLGLGACTDPATIGTPGSTAATASARPRIRPGAAR